MGVMRAVVGVVLPPLVLAKEGCTDVLEGCCADGQVWRISDERGGERGRERERECVCVCV